MLHVNDCHVRESFDYRDAPLRPGHHLRCGHIISRKTDSSSVSGVFYWLTIQYISVRTYPSKIQYTRYVSGSLDGSAPPGRSDVTRPCSEITLFRLVIFSIGSMYILLFVLLKHAKCLENAVASAQNDPRKFASLLTAKLNRLSSVKREDRDSGMESFQEPVSVSH